MPEDSRNPVIRGRWLTPSQRIRPTAASPEVLEHTWQQHREQCASPSHQPWPEVQQCPADACSMIFVCRGCGCVVAIGLGDTWCDVAEDERAHQFES